MAFENPREINLLPPPELTIPLWRSLARNLREYVHPESQPSLEVSAKPAQVGMLIGDIVDIPWYRTVFSNIGDVIAPETLPPLELESHPVDVGELIGDQIQRGWWTSLLRNLADTVAPERLPPLQISSAPIKPKTSSRYLEVPRWSALIDSPLISATRQSTWAPPTSLSASPGTSAAQVTSPEAENEDREVMKEIAESNRALHRARLREACWVSAAVVQMAFLIAWLFVGK